MATSKKPARIDFRLESEERARLEALAERLGKTYAQVFREALIALDVLTAPATTTPAPAPASSDETGLEPVERRGADREPGTRREYAGPRA